MDSKVEQLLLEADSLVAEFEQGGETVYINQAIDLDREALDLCPPSHSERFHVLGQLSSHLWNRYQRLGTIHDLNEAITLVRDALALCSPGNQDRSSYLNSLALYLQVRYRQQGANDDLNEAIAVAWDTLALCPPGHPERPTPLNNLALYLTARYNQLGNIDDLNQAIRLGREALVLCSPKDPDQATYLNGLALCIFARYRQLGEFDDLDEAIVLGRDALALCSPGDPGRSMHLSNLASFLSDRYKRLGEIDDLNEAIILIQEALERFPQGHPNRPTCLSNLSHHLSIRYEQLGAIDDLNQAIVLARAALVLCPPGHTLRSNYLSNLALSLSTRYKQRGGIEDLNEAIILGREALDLASLGNSIRPTVLSNLALSLFTRYRHLWGMDDLDEAIILGRDALELFPLGHPSRSTSLSNLAHYLSARYKRLGGAGDLNEAIVFNEDALAICLPGNPLRSTLLSNLAYCLSTRHANDDLHMAIIFSRDALALCSQDHPLRSMCLHNLALYLSTRYKQLEEIDDLNEAIVLSQDALVLLPLGHPERSRSLWHLSECLRSRFTRLGEVEDREELFELYSELRSVLQTTASSDMPTAKAWIDAAEEFHHPTTILAYETALRILVGHLAALPSLPRHLAVLKALASSLAVDAFSACLRNQSPTNAVELLEQGRSVFWSQLTRLRSPVDDVIASGPAGKALAGEFTGLTSLIRVALGLPGGDQHDQLCRLNSELRTVVSNIRELPGFSRFLLPSLFSDLQSAARDGPVIIVNASRYSCDVLVVFVDKDPVHIPLSVTQQDVRELSLELRALIKRAKSMDMTRELGLFLRELWDRIVSHIFEFLRTACPPQSRIWWCPTAEFSLLPLHAASPFRKGQKSVSDQYISSYTPTLSALIRARRSNPPNSVGEHSKSRFIAIGQAAAKGAGELVSVGNELANIGQLVEGLATFTRIEGDESSISRVAGELARHEWVHFACHGIPNRKEPFESAFALRDGQFTIQHIIQCELENPEFAYLSACYTTVGDEESPDEALHLASAMQFAGFRSVIGTMWAVDDAETNKVTSVFYKHMVNESGRLDHTRAAFALRKALISVKIPMDQRILYIHLGA